MRLLFISNLYPPHDIGGYEQICQEMVDYLSSRSHQVHVLTSRYGVANGQKATGSPEPRVGIQRNLHLEADMQFYKPLDFFLKRDRQERENIAAVDQAIDSFRPDLVVIWGMWNLSLNVAARAEAKMRDRVAYYLCSYWPEDPDLHRQYWQARERKRLLQAIKTPLAGVVERKLIREDYPPALSMPHVRCVSRYVRETLVESGRIPAHSDVLYNGIDLDPFYRPVQADQAPERPVRLLYFGSLFAHKGVITALQALSILKSQGQEESLRLTVLGSGHQAYVQELHEYSRRHSLDGMVNFIPRIPYHQVPAQLKSHDVFLFTSTWQEPLARSVMEAMAAGLLVIGTPVGGQAEMLVDGDNALTFPPGDASALAKQIRRVLRDPALGRSLAAAGQALVQNKFTLKRMGEEFENWLLSIVEP